MTGVYGASTGVERVSAGAAGVDAAGVDARAAALVRDAVLGDLARRVVSECGADVGLVGVPDRVERPGLMVLRHWAGTRAELLHDLDVPIGTGLGGRALAERAPTWVSDYRAATTISHHYDAAVCAEDLYAMLTVPLVADGVVHGVVYASLRSVVPFGDVRIGSVAGLAGAATRALAGAAAWCAAAVDRPAGRPTAQPVDRPAGRPGEAPRQPASARRLTPRELEVLRWAATGRTNPEIAAQLGLTRNTVTGYLKGAMHKLGARNRVELTLTARESGLVD
ncbi:hypothetical protein GCM10010441_41240 [Kitasatospora paracochleata]|uniref:DNA-binding CsgD family transcriptional regulator n=1 Tax=Kitasatospora paracochleata TaxID=58354 RepID=A0ABT1J5N3_9ACTN|nr:LuxR C-terminal-related transcriptional regulator [Kitasatospora paracochleata]MCP2312434.1 DNA-binding CsgD family transcriptional regulator [Kitasatospora paracochleata]